jgi:TRAP-type C4-dicarboxylate transport system substrate-binding protein
MIGKKILVSLFNLMVAILIVLTFHLSGTIAYSAEKPIELVFSSYLKENFTNNLTVQYWMEEVSKRTNGRVTFKTYYSGTLLKGSESLPGCSRGMCDLTLCPDGYTADRTPLSMVQSLLFMTDKMDAYMKSIYSYFPSEKLLMDEFTKNNLHLFAAIPVSSNILGAKENINCLASIKNKRVRSMSVIADTYSILGATPVGMSLGEVYDGIDKGVIDAYSMTDFTLASMFRLYEVAPYMIDTGMGQFGVMWFVINKKKWDRLPKDIQQTMTQVAEEAINKHVELYQEIESKMVDKAHEGGAKVVILCDEEKAKWKSVAAEKVWNKWIADMESKKLDGARIFKGWEKVIEEQNKNSTYKSPYKLFAERYGAE